MKIFSKSVLGILVCMGALSAEAKGKHLFILTGQSNMKYMDPNISSKMTGTLYKRLMRKVNPLLEQHKFRSMTLVWMQGEADAQAKNGDVYASSLRGLINQFTEDLGRKEINVVIGRLSDCDLENKHFPHWTIVRNAQVEVSDSNKRSVWVNTDDLNDGKGKNGRILRNNLHYSIEGYKKLGERFAEESIKLIKKHDLK
jgi:hypothetical protein